MSRTTFVTFDQLKHLNVHQQSQYILRRFMRLATLVPKRKNQLTFLSMIRSRYEMPYKERLQTVLQEDDKDTEVLRLERLLNTLAFANQAVYQKDESRLKLLMNLLEHEQSKQEYIKRNIKADPLLAVKFAKLKYFDPKMKNYGTLVSLREFDKSLMRLNQTLGTQL